MSATIVGVVCFMVGFTLGVLAMALFVMAGRDDERR